ncbi:30S ribosomal protein S16 [Flexistipes sinusarabici DSM 4947]|uniref:Small ribosomal subunit protein bS16 n=1 Tax=Flexistipes sinusarabici (strain ATCC 49648 / DSM 4947 / MAS 10) TaxID=717231 RepID=F8E4N6_FLESM|nr:30S ribosomal protein S16 [Flexistipes sinusarabici DSM 4947]
MATKIRLMRMGRKKRPYYRLVVADSRAKRDGRFIEIIGHYNPLPNPTEYKVDEEKALKWLSDGAVPTDTARSILSRAGIMKKFDEQKNQKSS